MQTKKYYIPKDGNYKIDDVRVILTTDKSKKVFVHPYLITGIKKDGDEMLYHFLDLKFGGEREICGNIFKLYYKLKPDCEILPIDVTEVIIDYYEKLCGEECIHKPYNANCDWRISKAFSNIINFLLYSNCSHFDTESKLDVVKAGIAKMELKLMFKKAILNYKTAQEFYCLSDLKNRPLTEKNLEIACDLLQKAVQPIYNYNNAKEDFEEKFDDQMAKQNNKTILMEKQKEGVVKNIVARKLGLDDDRQK